jgi:hypothetical protein
MEGDLRKGLLKQRKEVIADVGKSVSNMAEAITKLRSLKLKASKSEQESIRRELSRSLQMCLDRDAALESLDANELDEYAEEYGLD